MVSEMNDGSESNDSRDRWFLGVPKSARAKLLAAIGVAALISVLAFNSLTGNDAGTDAVAAGEPAVEADDDQERSDDKVGERASSDRKSSDSTSTSSTPADDDEAPNEASDTQPDVDTTEPSAQTDPATERPAPRPTPAPDTSTPRPTPTQPPSQPPPAPPVTQPPPPPPTAPPTTAASGPPNTSNARLLSCTRTGPTTRNYQYQFTITGPNGGWTPLGGTRSGNTFTSIVITATDTNPGSSSPIMVSAQPWRNPSGQNELRGFTDGSVAYDANC